MGKCCKFNALFKSLTMRQDRRCPERAAALKRVDQEAALALASAGCAVRMPQRDASVDMWRNPRRPQRSTGVKRKIYTENPHYHMNEHHEGCGTSHQIPSGGGFWGGCKLNKVLSVRRRNELMCVMHLPKEEPPWSKRDSANKRKAFWEPAQTSSVQREKGTSQRVFGHEYN